ncbi:group I truncated hemoglobin [Agaribacterium haliotis]|uniref:group I truncated hemoglobin n=1 Tax=Agaribacterium haliotis TaxID=2013869 RepID=UPI000BB582A5|nr:group 1 truncated hemoglobin [Agaribacterium haliotis]
MSNTDSQTNETSSLFERIGGGAAVNAAVDLFYEKIIADTRIKHFFDSVDMEQQSSKQKAFLTNVFGGPVKFSGKGMREAHKHLDLNETHFNAVAENLVATLTELKVGQSEIDEVVTIALSVKDDVLNK